MFWEDKAVQTIYFDSHSTQITVSTEGYKRIQAMIEQYRVCRTCEQPYSPENPQVSLNCCKTCFLRTRPHLVYLGLVSPEPAQYSGYQHQFLGTKGDVYVLGSETEHKDNLDYYKDKRQTLLYWQFPAIPERYEHKGEEIRLHDTYFHLYGDVCKDPVVLVVYNEIHTYAPDVHIVFVANRGGEYREFDKKKGSDRKVWQEAKKRRDATKDARGEYHIRGYARSWTDNSDLYYFAAEILSEQQQSQQ